MDVPATEFPYPRTVLQLSRSPNYSRRDAHPGEVDRLARGLRLPTPTILRFAMRHDELFFADILDSGELTPCWCLADLDRGAMAVRRLDGRPFTTSNGSMAASASSCAPGLDGWPIGFGNTEPRPAVLAVEDSMVLPCAWQILYLGLNDRAAGVTAIALPDGAGPIHLDALQSLSGRTVYILPSIAGAIDDVLRDRMSQLQSAGAEVGIFNYKACRIDGGSATNIHELCSPDCQFRRARFPA